MHQMVPEIVKKFKLQIFVVFNAISVQFHRIEVPERSNMKEQAMQYPL